ncbi:MAG: acyl--CoA ligase [Novosphingobium sp.]|nr:acyl--CoA ligase [Novosphingobium sp.]
MASELDRQLKSIMDRLTAPRSLFERDTVQQDGVALPVFANAPASIPALFDHACLEHHDAEFLVDGDLRLTYGEVHALARRAAVGLVRGYGVKPGDRIGIAARNSANWIIAYMAVLMAGGCATLLNAWCKGRELKDAVELAQCTIVLTDPERASRLEGQALSARIIVFRHGKPEHGLSPILACNGACDVLPQLDGDDLATILFTSGSTGRSKAAHSNHRSVVQAATSFAVQSLGFSTQLQEAGKSATGDRAILLCVPLFHVTGEIAVLLQSFLVPRRLVIMSKWDAVHAMRLIEHERITFFIGVPLMSHQIATHPDRARFDLSSCEAFAVGGAPQPAGHVGQIVRSMPHSVPLIGYGLTETNSVGCTNVHANYVAKPESTGPATPPLVELAIIGADGARLPTGETGEVAIRSVCNFQGYWNDADATAAAIRPDGFFMTGDLGYLDADGYLFIVDRIKEIIIRGGENLSCAEVEQAIYDHEGIAEACVFGVPDEVFGELPVAVYRSKPGCEASPEALHTFVSRRLATFKIPVRFWQESEALPLLGSHKIDRVKLKARYSQLWETARSAA